VVVFPGITLTIQPGVVVEFSSATQLEIRQAALIAEGTSTDSIKFTSNGAQSAGSWNNIQLNGGTMTSRFNYCSFTYATQGIFDNSTAGDSLIIRNSTFRLNTTGLDGTGTGHGVIDSCNFSNNTSFGANNVSGTIVNHSVFSYNPSGFVGVGSTLNNSSLHHNATGLNGYKGNTLNNCAIFSNTTGISCQRGCAINNCVIKNNQSGIITGGTIHDDNTQVYNCLVDSNSTIGISLMNRNDNISNNVITHNGLGLYDGNYDNTMINIIKQNFIGNNANGMHVTAVNDQITCNKICNNTTYDLQYTSTANVTIAHNYWCTPDSASTETVIYDGYDNPSYGLVIFMPIDSCGVSTGIAEHQSAINFGLYPNPGTGSFTISYAQKPDEISISDMLGQVVYETKRPAFSKTEITLEKPGIYFVTLKTGTAVSSKKLIISAK
jgi:hypothetical protein